MSPSHRIPVTALSRSGKCPAPQWIIKIACVVISFSQNNLKSCSKCFRFRNSLLELEKKKTSESSFLETVLLWHYLLLGQVSTLLSIYLYIYIYLFIFLFIFAPVLQLFCIMIILYNSCWNSSKITVYWHKHTLISVYHIYMLSHIFSSLIL